MADETVRPAHIVLIEDNPSDVYLMKLTLDESGLSFNLTNFQSGADALRQLCPATGVTSELPVPNLILLDLNTPRSDGFEILAKLKGNTRLVHVPIAVVTSSTSAADRHRAMLIGADMYIQKPTQLANYIEGIGSAVKHLLAGTQPHAT